MHILLIACTKIKKTCPQLEDFNKNNINGWQLKGICKIIPRIHPPGNFTFNKEVKTTMTQHPFILLPD